MSSKSEDKQIEALTKAKELREIKEDIELNGVHNPYGLRLLEANELGTKENLDNALKAAALEIINERYDTHYKSVVALLEEEQQ